MVVVFGGAGELSDEFFAIASNEGKNISVALGSEAIFFVADFFDLGESVMEEDLELVFDGRGKIGIHLAGYLFVADKNGTIGADGASVEGVDGFTRDGIDIGVGILAIGEPERNNDNGENGDANEDIRYNFGKFLVVGEKVVEFVLHIIISSLLLEMYSW